MNAPLVSVITASTGNPMLHKCLQSVKEQTHPNVQHLVYVDGPSRSPAFLDQLFKSQVLPMDPSTQKPGYRLDLIQLPYAVGTDRWNGHRMYGAGSYLADGEYVMFLDDDNYIDPDHIESLLATLQNTIVPVSGAAWSYSLRKIVNSEGFLCNDDCESLGKWPSVLHDQDFFVDVNCFFLPRMMAVQISPLWFRKFREPGQPEVDRVLTHTLRQVSHSCSHKYSLNYTVGNTQNSVQKEFFDRGNDEMMRRYNGQLPWKK